MNLVTSSSRRRIWFFLGLAAAGVYCACLVTGCKARQSETIPATPASPPKPLARQPVTAVPAVKRHIYPADGDPKAEIALALKRARRERKRVILEFGGDWCGDCQVLDLYLHQSPNAEILAKDYIVVPIDIGHFDKNVDTADQYGVPLKQGVPALAVLDRNGKVLYSQKTGEFGDMRYMHAASVTEFLNRWKA